MINFKVRYSYKRPKGDAEMGGSDEVTQEEESISDRLVLGFFTSFVGLLDWFRKKKSNSLLLKSDLVTKFS